MTDIQALTQVVLPAVGIVVVLAVAALTLRAAERGSFGWHKPTGFEREQAIDRAMDVALAEGFDQADEADYIEHLAASMNEHFRAYHLRLQVTPFEARVYLRDREAHPTSHAIRQLFG